MVAKNLFALTLLLVFLAGCSHNNNHPVQQQTIVIGLSGDIDTFNPLYTTDATAQEIVELLYPSLVTPEADTAEGTVRFLPSLAGAFEFRNNGRDILFHLRMDARWSDSAAVTAADVKSSFRLYADPAVGSVHQDAVQGLLRTAAGTLDIDSCILIVDDSTMLFRFAEASPSRLFDVALPIFPSHIYGPIAAAELRTHPVNKAPVTAGPFRLASWKAMQEIVLESDPLCVLPAPAAIRRIVLRIVPEPRTQIAQLRSRELDMILDLGAADAAELQRTDAGVDITAIQGRRYHFIGWNNIDQAAYARSKGKTILPHPLFGSPRTRLALTYAVDRPGLLNSLLLGYGEIANGPVAPFFRWAYDASITPHPFDPKKALELLAQDGWTDSNNDGVLDRQGKKFSFDLSIPAGAKFWADIATVLQKELRDIKIDMKIAKAERSMYWQSLIEKKYDAWIAGFEVPMELRLEGFWGSDLAKNQFNIFSYRNTRVDSIVTTASFVTDRSAAAASWKEFQRIVHTEQPCTFLFWENRLVAVNRNIQGTEINRLHTLRSAYTWTKAETN